MQGMSEDLLSLGLKNIYGLFQVGYLKYVLN